MIGHYYILVHRRHVSQHVVHYLSYVGERYLRGDEDIAPYAPTKDMLFTLGADSHKIISRLAVIISGEAVWFSGRSVHKSLPTQFDDLIP